MGAADKSCYAEINGKLDSKNTWNLEKTLGINGSEYKTVDVCECGTGTVADHWNCSHEDSKKAAARKLYFQLLLLCLSFFFTFSAYNGLESLQSSLHVEVGQVAVGIVYVILIACSLTVAPLCVSKLPAKACICGSWLCFLTFTLANMHPTWWTLTSSAMLVGFGASIVWIAQGVYISNIAQKYALLTGQDFRSILSHFNGIFFSIFATTLIVGNLIGSLLFHRSESLGAPAYSNITFVNVTAWNLTQTTGIPPEHPEDRNTTNTQVCGAQNCPYLQSHRLSFTEPDPCMVRILLYIFLTCNALGLITAMFLENFNCCGPQIPAASIKSRVKDVLLLIKDYRLLLLIMPMVSVRLFQAMSISDYNQAFVMCTLGIGMVGYIMMVRAIFYTVASYVSGCTGKCVPRACHFTVSACLYIIVCCLWLLWPPNPDQTWMFFFIPSLEGFASGIWRVQISVILGSLFQEKEAAFAHHNAWLALGNCIIFLSSTYFCFYIKCYFILVIIGLSIVSYSGLELKLRWNNTSASSSNTDLK